MKIIILLLILALTSCTLKESKIECDKKDVIQKCLNYLSLYDKKNKSITIINSNEITENMQLLWKDTPVSFEENNLKDIRNLVKTGKLYFIIDKVTCSKNKTDIGIICINANLKYEFELRRPKSGKETLQIIQETNDILPFR